MTVANSLNIIDISNPAVPVQVGGIAGNGAPNFLDNPRGIVVIGNYAYVTAADADDALTIIDISNPVVPTHAGTIRGAGAPNWLNGAITVWIMASVVPTVTTQTATRVGIKATLHGTITDDGGESCSVWFVYGTDSGSLTSSTDVQTGFATGDSFSDIIYLQPGINYFAAVSSNSAGDGTGATLSVRKLCGNPIVSQLMYQHSEKMNR